MRDGASRHAEQTGSPWMLLPQPSIPWAIKSIGTAQLSSAKPVQTLCPQCPGLLLSLTGTNSAASAPQHTGNSPACRKANAGQPASQYRRVMHVSASASRAAFQLSIKAQHQGLLFCTEQVGWVCMLYLLPVASGNIWLSLIPEPGLSSCVGAASQSGAMIIH